MPKEPSLPSQLAKFPWPKTEQGRAFRRLAVGFYRQSTASDSAREAEFRKYHAEACKKARALPPELAALEWPDSGLSQSDAGRAFEGYFEQPEAAREKWYRQRHALSWYHHRIELDMEQRARELEKKEPARVGLA